MYDEFFAKANELVQSGVPFATATVIYAQAPTSGKPGDRAIVTAEGVMYGWIGGSCAQPSVIKEARKAIAADECRLIRLSAAPTEQTPREGLIDLPMTCFSGGTLEIMIEPQLPKPRLLVVGNLPVAQALTHLGQALSYHVIAVDLDNEHGGMSHVDEILTSLDDIAEQVRPGTYVVVSTHGNYDELALERILKAHPTYVGLVASPKRARAVREYLTLQGLSVEELLPLKAPAGLDIQARRGDEIALSIMAEIIQRRRNADTQGQVMKSDKPEAQRRSAEGMNHDAFVSSPDTTALDMICGMQVAISSARYTHEYQGETYYFCSAACKTKFAQDPGKYLAKTVPSGEAIDPVCLMTVDIATAEYMSDYEGRPVYFCSRGCKKAFDLDPVQFIKAR
jgi:xanthine dehydrogenase accessory factor